MAKWSTAFINDLPDSSFAYIEAGSNKDSEGKTTPRSLRHLPYKDKSGAVDHAHVVNAIQRLPQTHNIPASEVESIRTKLQNALKQAHSSELSVQLSAGDEPLMLSTTSITPDENGELPKRFPLLTTFDLPNSNRGHFTVTPQDLDQIKEKFDAQIGFPSSDAGTGLMLDFDHQAHRKDAAAWIHALDVVHDPKDPTKATMFADNTEWTDEGAAAIKGGRYKMVSPSGAFGRRNGKLSVYPWHTDLKDKISNFICGAGLTNEPFQSMMAPIRLNANGGDLHSGYDNVIYVYDVQQKKEPSMNLDALRVKERTDLSVPELDFLAEKKDELSASERTKFKLDAAADNDNTDKLTDEQRSTLAAIADGSKKVVDASAQTAEKDRLDRMESTIEGYRKREVTALLDSHVKRGAIKADAAKLDGFWGKQLLAASSEDEQQVVKDALDALPSNEQLSTENGHGADVQAGSTAREQLTVLAKEKVDAAAKEGKTLLFADALKSVYKENADLRTQDSQESRAKASVVGA